MKHSDYVPGMEPNFLTTVTDNSVDYAQVRSEAKLLKQVKPKSNNLKIQPFKKVMDKINERIKSGNLSESFPYGKDEVSISEGTEYLIPALKETKQRLSIYYTICRGLA